MILKLENIKTILNKKWIYDLCAIIFIIYILTQIGNKNYLLFHSIVEIFCFMISFGIFTVSMNSRYFSKNNYYVFLGIGYFFIGVFKIMHTLCYPNIGILKYADYNLALQLYHSSRYIQVMTLLISCIIIYKPIKILRTIYIFIFYFIISSIFMVAIFYYKVFPVCYIVGFGSTNFKIISTLISSIVLLYVAFFYYKNRNTLNNEFANDITAYCILNAISELMFLDNINTSSIINMYGHILEVLAFYFIYKGFVEASFKKPYDLLFGKFTEASNDLKLKITENEAINQLLWEEKTYREKIEKALFQNKICSNLLMDNSPIAITVHSKGKIIFANNKLCELLELKSQEEIIGENVMKFMPEEYKEQIKAIIEEEYKKIDSVQADEMQIKNGKGKIIDVNLLRTHFMYEDKPATLAVFWISMNKQIEALKRNVKRNKELLNQSLKFNKLITEFFANISHELRTPLNVIFAATQVLELNIKLKSTSNGDKNEEKYLRTIRQNCYRLLRLINNLIDLSKVNSGFENIRLVNHNIVSIVEDITLSVADYIKDKNIELIFDTDVEEKIIACDFDKIERIILNLLSNAIKFTNAGDKIKVSIFDKKDKILISVQDTGIGIPKEKLDLIFERFRQVDSSLSRNREGSGIGLSLIKSFVEMHGGKITVKSEVGVGTNFIIELPVRITDEEYDFKKDIISDDKVERINIEFSDIYQ